MADQLTVLSVRQSGGLRIRSARPDSRSARCRPTDARRPVGAMGAGGASTSACSGPACACRRSASSRSTRAYRASPSSKHTSGSSRSAISIRGSAPASTCANASRRRSSPMARRRARAGREHHRRRLAAAQHAAHVEPGKRPGPRLSAEPLGLDGELITNALRSMSRLSGAQMLGFGTPQAFLPLRQQLQTRLEELEIGASAQHVGAADCADLRHHASH